MSNREIGAVRRREILDFMLDYRSKTGESPCIREICEGVGLSSPSAVHSHIKQLRRQGFIDYRPGRNRGNELKNVTPSMLGGFCLSKWTVGKAKRPK